MALPGSRSSCSTLSAAIPAPGSRARPASLFHRGRTTAHANCVAVPLTVFLLLAEADRMGPRARGRRAATSFGGAARLTKSLLPDAPTCVAPVLMYHQLLITTLPVFAAPGNACGGQETGVRETAPRAARAAGPGAARRIGRPAVLVSRSPADLRDAVSVLERSLGAWRAAPAVRRLRQSPPSVPRPDAEQRGGGRSDARVVVDPTRTRTRSGQATPLQVSRVGRIVCAEALSRAVP
jgi:hypothetical protein